MDILEELDTLRLGPSEYKIVQKAYTEIERLREALQRIVEVTDYGTKTSTTMSEFAVNNANILARSALQQTQSSHAQMSDDKGQR